MAFIHLASRSTAREKYQSEMAQNGAAQDRAIQIDVNEQTSTKEPHPHEILGFI